MDILLIIIIFFIAAFVQGIIYKKLALKNIEYKIYINKTQVFENEEILIIEEVFNNKFLPVTWLKTEISTSGWLEFFGTKSHEASKNRFVPSVFFLGSHKKCIRKWRVKCIKRGVFYINDISMNSSDLLGFIVVSKKISCSEKITVLPISIEVEKNRLSNQRILGEILAKRHFCEDPFLISGLREYTTSDPMNKIHWKTSAKQNNLMVYNNDFTTENNVLIALNLQKSGDGGIRPVIENVAEHFIKVVVFAAESLCENNTDFAFCSNGGLENDCVFLNSSRGYVSYSALLNTLAELEITANEQFHEYLQKPDLSVYTDIIVITSYIDDKLQNFAINMYKNNINVCFYCNENEYTNLNIYRAGIAEDLYSRLEGENEQEDS